MFFFFLRSFKRQIFGTVSHEFLFSQKFAANPFLGPAGENGA
jgi:hypothetical protein